MDVTIIPRVGPLSSREGVLAVDRSSEVPMKMGLKSSVALSGCPTYSHRFASHSALMLMKKTILAPDAPHPGR